MWRAVLPSKVIAQPLLVSPQEVLQLFSGKGAVIVPSGKELAFYRGRGYEDQKLLPAYTETRLQSLCRRYAAGYKRVADRGVIALPASLGELHKIPINREFAQKQLQAPKIAGLLPAKATRQMRIFSFGGGVQSHTVLALQALGKLNNPYDAFVFANVGADSENPETLEYIEKYTKPFCKKHGIKFIEVQKHLRDGTPDTLVQRLYREKRSIVIPARMGNGAPGNRNCTEDHKINVVDKWIKQEKLTHVVIGLGISTDEFHRARDTQWHDKHGSRKLGFNKRREYPLIEMRISRAGCASALLEAGLPMPPKSSCFFCPFKRRGEWIDMKRDQPELFAKAVDIEREINAKRVVLRKDGIYLHSSCKPLEKAVGDQLSMFDEVMGSCDSGYCWT